MALPLPATKADADVWPSRPIRMVVPFPAGGSADLSARLVAEGLRPRLGEVFIVENRPGAGGNLAAAAVARLEPDGYTMFIGTTGIYVFNQFIYTHPGFDAIKDFAALATIWTSPNLCVVSPSLPVRTLGELAAYAKENPGKLNFGSSGIGVSTHLAAELFQRETGTKLTHVPYRGQAPALTDLIAGQIQVMFPIVADVLPHIRSGAVKALAITAEQRAPLLPDVPTVVESGFKTLVFGTWVGAFVRSGTPGSIVDRINAELKPVLDSSEYRQRMNDLGFDVAPIYGEMFTKQIIEEQRLWGKLISDLGIKVD